MPLFEYECALCGKSFNIPTTITIGDGDINVNEIQQKSDKEFSIVECDVKGCISRRVMSRIGNSKQT